MEPAKDMALEYLHSQLRKRTVDSDSDGAFTPPMPGSPHVPLPSSPPQRPRGYAPAAASTPMQYTRRSNGFSFNPGPELRSQSADRQDLKGLRRPDLSGLVGALDAELRKERKFPGQGAMPPRLGFGSLPGSARYPPGSMPGGPGSGRFPSGPASPGSGRYPVGGASGNAAPAAVPKLSLPPSSPPRPPASPRVSPVSNDTLVPSYSMLTDAAVSPRSRTGSKQVQNGRSPSPSHMPAPQNMVTNNPMAFVWNQPQVNSPRNSPRPPEALRGRLPPEGGSIRAISGPSPARAISGSSADLDRVQARTYSMLGTPRHDARLSSVATKTQEAAGGGMPGLSRARSPASHASRPFSPGPPRSPRGNASPTRQPGPAREQNAARQRSASPTLPFFSARTGASPSRQGALPMTHLASVVPRWSEAPPTASQFPRVGSPMSPRPGSPILSPRGMSLTLPITTTIVSSTTGPMSSETGTVWSWKMTMAPSEAGSIAVAPGAGSIAVAPGAGSIAVAPGAGSIAVAPGVGSITVAPGAGSIAMAPGHMAQAMAASTAPALYGATTSTVTVTAPGPWAGGSLTAPPGRSSSTLVAAPTLASGTMPASASPDSLTQSMSAAPFPMTGPSILSGSLRFSSTSPSTMPASVNAPSLVPGATVVASTSSVPTAVPTPTMPTGPTPYASTQTLATSTTIAAASVLQAATPTATVTPSPAGSESAGVSTGLACGSPAKSNVLVTGGLPGPPRASSGQPFPVAHAAASGTSATPVAATSASGIDWATKVIPPSPTPAGATQYSATTPSVNIPAASAAPSSTPPVASSVVAQPGAPKTSASEPVGM